MHFIKPNMSVHRARAVLPYKVLEFNSKLYTIIFAAAVAAAFVVAAWQRTSLDDMFP